MLTHAAARAVATRRRIPLHGGALAVDYTIPLLPVPRTTPPRTAIGRWLTAGERLSEPQHAGEAPHPWRKVLWLTGVDYFSTLGYQPGIALLEIGRASCRERGEISVVAVS